MSVCVSVRAQIFPSLSLSLLTHTSPARAPAQAESNLEIEAWVCALTAVHREVSRRSSLQELSTLTAWTTKVKNGYARKRWASLMPGCVVCVCV